MHRRRNQEDLKVVPYNAELTRNYKCHIDVERTKGGCAVAYLMKYAFEALSNMEVKLATSPGQNPSDGKTPGNITREIIPNDPRLYMRARVTVDVEAEWNRLEFSHVLIEPNVEAYSIHLKNERKIIIWNPTATGLLNDSLLIRYFKHPEAFRSLPFLEYFETVLIYNPRNIPAIMRSWNAQSFVDNAPPRACVVARQYMDHAGSVARIRFVSPSDGKIFALRHIILERPMDSYQKGMYWERIQYNTWRETAISMGLYQDGYEQEKAFDEVVGIRVTPSGVRFFNITLMRH